MPVVDVVNLEGKKVGQVELADAVFGAKVNQHLLHEASRWHLRGLRVFSPSTFSRRWPSTNGPFFSERAIDPLFLHSPQTAPLRPAHFLEAPHRPRNAVRLRAERANKPRALRVGDAFHDDRPARLAKLVQHRLRGSHHYLNCRTYCLGILRGYALGRSLCGRS